MDKEFDNLVPKDFQKDLKNLETNGNNSFLLELKRTAKLGRSQRFVLCGIKRDQKNKEH